MTQINHPDYYAPGKYETINVIEDMGLGLEFCLGNAIKYLSRAGKKNAETYLDDLKKAWWYLDRASKEYEKSLRYIRPATMIPSEIIRAWDVETPIVDILSHIFIGHYGLAMALLSREIEKCQNKTSSQ